MSLPQADKYEFLGFADDVNLDAIANDVFTLSNFQVETGRKAFVPLTGEIVVTLDVENVSTSQRDGTIKFKVNDTLEDSKFLELDSGEVRSIALTSSVIIRSAYDISVTSEKSQDSFTDTVVL